MIVEAMKTMNHVPSTSDGEVKKILIEDGQPVEFVCLFIILIDLTFIFSNLRFISRISPVLPLSLPVKIFT